MQNAEIDEFIKMQENVAHVTHQVDELSQIIAEQQKELERLRKVVSHLLEREAAQLGQEQNSVILSDSKPPHW